MAKMEIRGSSTVELFFDGVQVPAANLLGREGDGFKVAMQTLDGARLSTAAQALGLAQGAWDRAVEYASERRQFGRPISSFQAVGFKLVDAYISIAAARALLYDIARLVDRGAPRDLLTGLAAVAKTACSDVAMRVTTEAVQLFGGYGYIRDNEIERYMRDAKITQIYDGSNELNRVVAARSLGISDA